MRVALLALLLACSDPRVAIGPDPVVARPRPRASRPLTMQQITCITGHWTCAVRGDEPFWEESVPRRCGLDVDDPGQMEAFRIITIAHLDALFDGRCALGVMSPSCR